MTPQPVKTAVQEFADKHDICAFGRELLVDRKKLTTLEQAWNAGEFLCTAFMYVKGVSDARASVFFIIAESLFADLYHDGFTDEAMELRRRIDAFTVQYTGYFEMQESLNLAVASIKRRESAEATTGKLRITIARNIALFALDFASQTRFGVFDLKFSYKVADKFREFVGPNPFVGQ